MYSFALVGKIKPYVRTTRRSLWNEQSREYAASKAALQLQFSNQMQWNKWDRLPSEPLGVTIRYTVPSRLHTFDLDNVVKAVLDAANKIVFKDDRWVDYIWANRSLGEDYESVIKIGLLEDFR